MKVEEALKKGLVPHCEQRDCNMQLVTGATTGDKNLLLVKGSKCKKVETVNRTLIIAFLNKFYPNERFEWINLT